MSPPPPDVDVPGGVADEERTGTFAHAVVIAVASLALAWAGFQGSEWGRERLAASDESAALREESDQLSAEADRLQQQDTMLYVAWLASVESGDQEGADRRFSMFRPEIQEYLLTAPTNEDGVPVETPFESSAYDVDAKREEAEQIDAERREQDEQAREASDNTARYAGMGVLFAVALVVTGIAGRFDDSYGRGLRFLGAALLVMGLVFLLLVPLSFWAP